MTALFTERATLPRRIADRLVPIPDTGCFLWEGCVNEKGYGIVWWEGRKQRLIRVVLSLRLGRRVRSDREVLHSCDTPACAAELHLKEGTTRQNARERHARGRTGGIVKSQAGTISHRRASNEAWGGLCTSGSGT